MTRRGETTAPQAVAQIIGQLTTGGAELQLCELLERLDRRRYLPIVYSLSEARGPAAKRLEEADVPVRYVGSVAVPRARRLAAAMQRDRIALAHSWLFLANTYAWAASWFGSRVVLVTSARNCKSQGRLHHIGNMAAFRHSARVIANSAEVRDYVVRRYRAERDKIEIVHNGVDTERFHAVEMSGDAPPIIVTAGRLVTQKNPQLFVEAAARLRERMPNTRFRMIGEGPLRPLVLAAARAAGLSDAFELMGERCDMEDLLRSARLFWLTSSWEGLPNVVLEAMASGLPVIATDVGGTGELVRSGQEGFLVPPDDADAFARHAVSILRDPALEMRLKAAARRRSLEFSLPRMVAGTESVYARALEV